MPSTTAQGGLLDKVTAFGEFFKTRINNIDIFDEHYRNEAKTNPFYALGPIFYLVWFVVMVTGCLLIMWYVPTKPAAFDSIFKIQTEIPFGGIIRGMHKYGADAMIIAATLRLYRMFIMADYKPGKELNIAIGLVTLLLSMYSGLTGYLLIWNQRAFWATKVFATFPTYMDQFPVMGDFYQPLVKSLHMGWNTAETLLGGGAAITQETITRFFSLHLAFSLIPLILVELYFYKNAYERMPINWTKRIIIVMMLVIVAIILPAAQGRRSNPDVTPLPILSDWYFLGLYQMYKYLEPVVATEITMLIPLTVVAIPFLDTFITGAEKNIMKRPFVLMFCVMGFWSWVIFSYLIIVNIANIHVDPPYWRDFLWGTIDIGILWQCFLVYTTKDPVQKAKSAMGAVSMAVLAAIQLVLAVMYYYMAKTEMFFSPITQAWTYMAFRPFGAQHFEKAEALVKQLMIANKDYWNYPFLLDPHEIAKVGEPAAKEQILQLAQVCQQPTAMDWLFKLIPTFTPAPHAQYYGLVDYMVNNRWCFDYVTFTMRMTEGQVPPYPLQVPEMDWFWMVGSLAATVVSIAIVVMLGKAPAKKADEAPKVPVSSST
ncbi:MAG: cytochrome b N-terminal domain-containing protein [Candidatus Obscuribacterales bacterium]|nr:cytochrome b N-terminal domain-containing protein [Candidatus Obscuribacterales bacterium]